MTQAEDSNQTGAVATAAKARLIPALLTRRLTLSGPVAWYACFAILLLVALLLFVPWRPGVSVEGLDPSWVMGLDDAFATHKHFGSQIVFTMGPYGFLYARFYHPATLAPLLVLWALLAALTALVLWGIARRRMASPFPALLWAAAILFIVWLTPGYLSSDALAIVLRAAFVAWCTLREGPRRAVYLFVAALALISLIKFTFAALAVVTVVALAVEDARTKRWRMLTVTAFAAALAALWLAAGQALKDLPLFLHRSFLVAAGYNDAMARQTENPAGSLVEIVLYLLCASLLVTAAAVRYRADGFRAAVLRPTFLSAMLFIVFKTGFVSHDRHGVLACFAALALALLFAPVMWRGGGRMTRPVIAAALVAGMAAAAHSVMLRGNYMPRHLRAIPRALSVQVSAAVRLVRGTRYVDDAYNAARAQTRGANPLPPIKGSVDIYPHNQGVVLAWDLPYHPRPVFQSYSAYLPALAEINAAHLRGRDAPDTLLFDVRSYRDVFPAMQDGLSWLEILGRYDPRSKEGKYLLFEKAPARSVSLKEKARLSAAFGEWVSLPAAAAPVWAKVVIRPTPAGRAASLLYKVPWTTMSVRTSDGRTGTYRLVTAIAAGGFLLSPVVDDADSFARLASQKGTSPDPVVTALRITRKGEAPARPYYEDPIDIALFDLDIAR